MLDIAVKEEACSLNLAPTASTAAALAMGDALAIALLERRGFKEEDFAALHPGGRLGKKLRRIEALMHTGEDVPRVLPTAKMPDVIYEMSRKGLGLAAVTGADGPLARHHHRRRPAPRDAEAQGKCARTLTAADCMTKNPVTLPRTELAASRPAPDGRKEDHFGARGRCGRTLEGVLHIHDLWTLQLF